MPAHTLPALSDGRTRYVSQQWLRDPSGPLLKKPAPKGVRAPNGMIWGHGLKDFFWIQRIPNVDILTIWSRTMIKELGENYDEKEFEQADALQHPRQRHPWPVLRLPKDIAEVHAGLARGASQYGVIDQGCDAHSQAGHSPRYREEPIDEAQAAAIIDEELRSLVQRLLGVEDDGCFVRNDPKNPVVGSHGRPYPLLWAPHVRQVFTAMRACLPQGVPAISRTIQCSPFTVVELDEVGVQVLSALDDEALEHLLEQPLTTASPTDPTASDSTSNNAAELLLDELSLGASNINEEAHTECLRTDAHASEGTAVPPVLEDIGQHSATSGGVTPNEDSDTPTASGFTAPTGDTEVPVAPKADRLSPTTDTSKIMDQVPAKDMISENSPFSTKDIPRLEEFLPVEYYPDFLHVHDPHSVTTDDEYSYKKAPSQNSQEKPWAYKRVFPKLARDIQTEETTDESKIPADVVKVPPRVAHLHLAQQNRMGVGHHSLVHRAPLTLPAPLTAHSRNGHVVVAAKSAFPVESARELLQKEAKIYDLFPKQLMQDWCGYNLVTPIKHPVPVGPVVPKFYGYYVPLETVDGKERLCDELDVDAPSPILLLEQCGDPVEPDEFTLDER